jgi:hypothetical protein
VHLFPGSFNLLVDCPFTSLSDTPMTWGVHLCSLAFCINYFFPKT